MAYIIVGLGNPGEEYEGTRHNTGWAVVEALRRAWKFPDWKEEKKLNVSVSRGKYGKKPVVLLLPQTMMNNSGQSLVPLIKTKKSAEKLLVVHDDLDLPLGKFKLSFGRGSGGHRGVESIIKKIKTRDFTRLRVGVVPTTPTGKFKKPKAGKPIIDFILGKFKPSEKREFKNLIKKQLVPVIESALHSAGGR